jgi:hypothetical protein
VDAETDVDSFDGTAEVSYPSATQLLADGQATALSSLCEKGCFTHVEPPSSVVSPPMPATAQCSVAEHEMPKPTLMLTSIEPEFWTIQVRPPSAVARITSFPWGYSPTNQQSWSLAQEIPSMPDSRLGNDRITQVLPPSLLENRSGASFDTTRSAEAKQNKTVGQSTPMPLVPGTLC